MNTHSRHLERCFLFPGDEWEGNKWIENDGWEPLTTADLFLDVFLIIVRSDHHHRCTGNSLLDARSTDLHTNGAGDGLVVDVLTLHLQIKKQYD